MMTVTGLGDSGCGLTFGTSVLLWSLERHPEGSCLDNQHNSNLRQCCLKRDAARAGLELASVSQSTEIIDVAQHPTCSVLDLRSATLHLS